MTRPVPQELLQAVQAAWEREPRINLHRWPLRLWEEEGTVVLDGEVGDIAAKRLAALIARRHLEGRWPLLDLVRLAAEPVGDGALRDEVEEVLSREGAFAGYDILARVGEKVELVQDAEPEAGRILATVHQGVVVLEGRVQSLSHCRLAEVLVWWTAGCQRVDNRLQVFPPEEDSDDELADAVRLVLEKDPMVHADRLLVRVRQRRVQLQGALPSEEERTLAVRDCWYVPGTEEVEDAVEVIPPA
ncbi:MAG: BON domain-containing protein [Gammaproteobacteria bacterium]|nr:MAG: BON domain-containing protein [Gammaproteobacteria bacterium]